MLALSRERVYTHPRTTHNMPIYMKYSELIKEIEKKVKEKFTLILIQGLPGSGKTTLAKKIVNSLNISGHYEADQFFEKTVDGKVIYKWNPKFVGYAHQWCMAMTADKLNHKQSVIVSNTFTSDREINPYIQLSKDFGSNIIIIRMGTMYNTVHNVPAEAIEKMKKRMSNSLSINADYIYTEV